MNLIRSSIRNFALLLLAAYKRVLSPFLHTLGASIGLGGCGFQPTCSEYAQIAFATHPPHRALWLTLRRVLRCHPFHSGGLDLVPPSVPPAFTMKKTHTQCALLTHDRK